MVKIRLRRIGTKGRPFYRVVVAKSAAGRNGAFVETLGTYDPVAQPHVMQVNEERALYWLRHGAEPTQTTAYILNKVGVLPKFFDERPTHKAKYKFLDKRTATMSVESHVSHGVDTEPEVVEKPKATVKTPEVEVKPQADVESPEVTETSQAPVENPSETESK